MDSWGFHIFHVFFFLKLWDIPILSVLPHIVAFGPHIFWLQRVLIISHLQNLLNYIYDFNLITMKSCFFKQQSSITEIMIGTTSHGKSHRINWEICISQLIRYTRPWGSYHDFLDIEMLLIRKLLNKGFLMVVVVVITSWPPQWLG